MAKATRRKATTVNSKRWAAYALAGLATTNAMNATTEVSMGDIIVGNPNFTLNDDGYLINLPGSSSLYGFDNAILLYHTIISNSSGRMNVGEDGVFFVGFVANSYAYPSNVPYGENISTLSFNIPANFRGDMAWGSGYMYSNFLDTGTSYLAFRFNTSNGTQYGWAEVVMDNNRPLNTGVLTRYAYTTEGERLAVGQIPEPGALGLLALGSIGLTTWRRRRRGA